MTAVSIIVAILLFLSFALTLLCAIGVLVMRDPLQRLHFIAPPASLSAFFVVAAVLVQEHSWQSATKVLLIAMLLALVNGVATHATARAALVHMASAKPCRIPERVDIVDEEGAIIGEADMAPGPRGIAEASPWH
jgi:monovalent cation/proton antiporter MnhG/PhaG subunit